MTVDTTAGAQSGLTFELEPARALDLGVSMWSGLTPEGISIGIVDDAGERVAAQYLRKVGGRFRMKSAPPGRWKLLLMADGAAVTTLPVEVPGQPIEVVLSQEARIDVNLEAIANEAGIGTVRVASLLGSPLRIPAFGRILSEWPIMGVRTTISSVPAGDWIVEYVSAAGQTWRTAVSAVAGQTVEARLE